MKLSRNPDRSSLVFAFVFTDRLMNKKPEQDTDFVGYQLAHVQNQKIGTTPQTFISFPPDKYELINGCEFTGLRSPWTSYFLSAFLSLPAPHDGLKEEWKKAANFTKRCRLRRIFPGVSLMIKPGTVKQVTEKLTQEQKELKLRWRNSKHPSAYLC